MTHALKKHVAALLTAAILLSLPGPGAMQAFASMAAASRGAARSAPAAVRLGAVPVGISPALRAVAPSLAAPRSAPTAIAAPRPSVAPARSALPVSAVSPAAAPIALPAARRAASASAVKKDAAYAARAAGDRRSALAAGRKLDQNLKVARQGGSAAAQAPILNRFWSGRRQGAESLGVRAAARPDGSRPDLNPSGAPAGGQAAESDPAPASPHTGGPTAPTRPYSLGAILGLKHKIAVWWNEKTGWDNGWPHFPAWARHLALAVLYSRILTFRQQNMFDMRHKTDETAPEWKPEYENQRSPDGSFIDKKDGGIGQAGRARGHNVPLDKIERKELSEERLKELADIAEELLRRRSFIPVPGVNASFAFHLQAMIHGWFNTVRRPPTDNPIKIPLSDKVQWPERTVTLDRTEEAPNLKPEHKDGPPVFTSNVSDAWDASQIYGSSLEEQRALRSFKDGKMRLGEDGLLPADPATATEDGGGLFQIGFMDNQSVPLMLEQDLWVREHNAIAEKLQRTYAEPQAEPWHSNIPWTRAWLDRKIRAKVMAMNDAERDEWLYQTAKMNNALLIALVHTDPWTRTLLPNPAISLGLYVDAWGFLGRRFKRLWFTQPWVHNLFGWLLKRTFMSGLPGSKKAGWSAPHNLGQTFALVYRLRELTPDTYVIRSHKTGEVLETLELSQMLNADIRRVMSRHSLLDLWYSIGHTNPGDVVLNNSPDSLRELRTQDGQNKPMHIVDLVRPEERGQPRYNEFLRAFGIKPPKTFFELTGGDEARAAQLHRLYNGDIEAVHTHIGIRAQPRPPGMLLSLVAFYVFGIQALARFALDRFYTTKLRPEVYTPAGLAWTFGSLKKEVILRHFPELSPALEGKVTGFEEFNDVGVQREKTALERRYSFLTDGGKPVAKLWGSYRKLRGLGIGRLKAFTTTLASQVLFGPKTQRGMSWKEKRAAGIGLWGLWPFHIYLPNIAQAQGYSSSRIYAAADNTRGLTPGEVDMAEFDRMFSRLAHEGGYMTAKDFRSMHKVNRRRDAAEGRGNFFTRWLGQLMAKHRTDTLVDLYADLSVTVSGKRVPAISRGQLLRFYQGEQLDVTLPEGGFKGTTKSLKGRDVMALQLRKDPADPNAYYAVLSEYTRNLKGARFHLKNRFLNSLLERVVAPLIDILPRPIDAMEITRWVPRMHSYRLQHVGGQRYELRPLRVSKNGGLEADPDARPDLLTLRRPGSLKDAMLTRFAEDGSVAEAIQFKGGLVSTWEDMVPGKFFGTKDSTGGDYFRPGVNTALRDGVVEFNLKDIKGRFKLVEKAPGLFTFKPIGSGHVGADKLRSMIGVFIDIMNWKRIGFMTNELLLINPDDPKDVGFFYERH